MHESWYFDQFYQYKDGFHNEFEIFGLESQGLDACFSRLEKLDAINILDWVDDSKHQEVSPGQKQLRLLYAFTRKPSCC